MTSTRAIARMTWIIILVIIIVVAGIGIGGYLYLYKPPTPGVTVPDFVNNNIVILETGAQPQWLDPHVSYYQYDYWILQHSVENLLWYNGSSSTQIIPWLTESWTPSFTVTNNTYTVKLRPNIQFQDGTPLNSTAVYFSMNRLLIMDGTSDDGVHGSQAAWIIQQLLNQDLSAYFSGGPPSAYNYTSSWVKQVLDQKFIEIVDNLTFKIHIQTKTTQFPYLFSQPWAAIVSPSEVIKKEYAFHTTWGSPSEAFSNMTKYFVRAAGEGHTYYNVPRNGWKMGTGPYYLDSFDPTTYRVVLKVNSNYWGGPNNFQYPVGTPKIKEIDFNFVESFSTRFLDLKAGKATGIDVSTADIYSVIDRDTWLNAGTFKSLVDGVTIHGPFNQFTTTFLNFITNVTDPATGQLRKFQPLADKRIRLAIASAVNITDININVNNRLGQVAINAIPPGTAPEGSHNSNIKPQYSYNLKKATELIVDSMKNPITSFTHYNGTPISSGIVDNHFGDTNDDGKAEISYNVDIYVPVAAATNRKILETIAINLNKIAPDVEDGGNATGLYFSIVTVPGGQQYTLAQKHQIYMYTGGWVADYNHIIDWLGPMFKPTGAYPAWNFLNYTKLAGYVSNAEAADTAGNFTALKQYNDLANQFANDNVLFLYFFYPTAYFVRSSFLKGWYFNVAVSVEYFASMHYETTP